MQIYNIKDFIGGWFIGNFVPNIINNKEFEIGYHYHKAGEVWPKHYHKLAREITLLIKGKMTILDKEINGGELFLIEPYEVADPVFLEDCEVIIIKLPSVPGDKYLV